MGFSVPGEPGAALSLSVSVCTWVGLGNGVLGLGMYIGWLREWSSWFRYVRPNLSNKHIQFSQSTNI